MNPLVLALLPIALELGMEIWNQIAALSQGKLPSFDELLQLNAEIQAKIDSQKLPPTDG